MLGRVLSLAFVLVCRFANTIRAAKAIRPILPHEAFQRYVGVSAEAALSWGEGTGGPSHFCSRLFFDSICSIVGLVPAPV